MSFTKTLLAGVAFSALTAASATAFVGPVASVHLVQGSHGNKAIHLTAAHHKTNVQEPGSRVGHYTYTLTFNVSFPLSSAYKNPIPLPAYAWINNSTCTQSGKSKIKYSKDSHATIKKTTSTGSTSACPSSTFTFYGGTYTLTDKKAKSDSFVGKLSDKHTSSGYNLLLVENFNVTFTK